MTVPFGVQGPPRLRIVRRDQRGYQGRVIFTRPPLKPYFFQSGPFMVPRIIRQDRRGSPGRVVMVRPPRPLVTFAVGVMRRNLMVRQDARGFRGSFLITHVRRLDVPSVVIERTLTAVLMEAGYEAKLLP